MRLEKPFELRTQHLKVCLLDKTFKRQAQAITSSYLIWILMQLKTKLAGKKLIAALARGWIWMLFIFVVFMARSWVSLVGLKTPPK